MHLIIHFSYALGQVSSWTPGPGPSGENMWKLAWAHGEVRHVFCSILTGPKLLLYISYKQ